jgi:DNA polymerase elongation subunit (family B)
MSPETITGMHVPVTVDKLLDKEVDTSHLQDYNYTMAANGWCFRREKRGLLPTLMEFYYNQRVVYKKQMLKVKQEYADTGNEELQKEISRLNNLQMAMKILLNSAYGACGNPWFRYYDLRIAGGITISGQLSIRWIANKLNEMFNGLMKNDITDRIVLIDTDSVVLTVEDLIDKFYPNKTDEQTIRFMDRFAEDKIQPFINKSYQELADYMNAYEQKMVMKRENLVDTMISVSKKRYFMSVHNSEGVQYKEPKLKIMGLQMVKSSTPAVIRDKLRDSLKTILYGSESDVQQYCDKIKTEFHNFNPTEIAFPRSISDVAKYSDETMIFKKSTPIHVRGALLYNDLLKKMKLTAQYPLIREGDKIKFLYLKTPNPIHEDVISFFDVIPPEFQLTEYVDYGKMYEKTFQDAIQNILDSLGWTTTPQATLEDMFVYD